MDLEKVNVPGWVSTSVGIFSIVLSLLYRVPQVYKIYKTKKGNDISKWMLWIQNTSYVASTAYGVFQHDWIYIIASIVSFVQNMIVLLMIRRYKAPPVKAPLDKEATEIATV